MRLSKLKKVIRATELSRQEPEEIKGNWNEEFQKVGFHFQCKKSN